MEERKQLTRVEELTYEVKIEQVMTADVFTVTPDTMMSAAKESMRKHRISGMPVLEEGRLAGVISTEDIIITLERGGDVAVREKIGKPVLTCFADEPLAQAIRRFDMHGYGRFPVVNRRGRLVGIITRGDIIHGLLRALELDYHEEEILQHEASYLLEHVDSERTRIFLSYGIKARDFVHAGYAAKRIKRALIRLGAHPQSVRRVAIAAFEAETNIIIHSYGGRIAVLIEPDAIRVRATDTGPGISDVEMAMKPGFSTAPDWVREMGFGSGMGLTNIRRCASAMRLDSIPGRKTCLEYTVIPEKSIALREQLKRGQNDLTRNSRPIIVDGKNRSAQVDEPD